MSLSSLDPHVRYAPSRGDLQRQKSWLCRSCGKRSQSLAIRREADRRGRPVRVASCVRCGDPIWIRSIPTLGDSPMVPDRRRSAFLDDRGREWVISLDPVRLPSPFARETAAKFVAMARRDPVQISELINTPQYVGSFVKMTLQVPLKPMDAALEAFLDRLDHSDFRPVAEAFAEAIEAAAADPKASEHIRAALATLRGDFLPAASLPPIRAVPPWVNSEAMDSTLLLGMGM